MNLTDVEWKNIQLHSFSEKRCSCCKYCKQCRYFQTRRSLHVGNDIVITNQGMLISHLRNSESGNGIFNRYASTIVIDEAHNLEGNVRNALTTRIKKQVLMDEFRRQFKKIQYLKKPSDRSKGITLMNTASSSAILVFRMIREMIKKQSAESEDAVTYFYDSTKENTALIERLIDSINRLSVHLYSNGISVDRLNEFNRQLKEIISEKSDQLVWLECNGGETFCYCKKDIRPVLSRLLYSNHKTTILTSATLSNSSTGTPREKCEYFLDNIGFPLYGRVSEPKKSPFDNNSNARLYCPSVMPYPDHYKKEEYRTASIGEIVTLLNVTDGKSLILFTSKQDMEYVYKKLSNMNLPYKILIQGENSSQTVQLNKFKDDTNSVILGTGTYWEGINVEGESLSQVIIYKLPFPVPDPIIQNKMDSCENPVYDVAVPEMIIKLKEGCGRLIRSSTDKGIVSILDSRMSSQYNKKYRNIVKNALSINNEVYSINELQYFWNNINEGISNEEVRAG